MPRTLAFALASLTAGVAQADVATPVAPIALEWRAQKTPTDKTLNGVFSDGRNLWVTGNGGVIFRSRDDGATWEKQRSPVGDERMFFDIWGLDAGNIYIVGDTGTIIHTSDGAHWVRQTTGVSESLTDVWGSGSRDVYAVGMRGTVLHSSDGVSWEDQVIKDRPDLIGVGGTAGSVFAVGSHGTILHTTDDGRTWRREESGTNTQLLGVWNSGGGHVFAVGNNGIILHTSDDGATWTQQSSHVTDNLIRVWGRGQVLAVGSDGAVVRTSDAGRTWTPQATSTSGDLWDVWGGGHAVHAAGANGTLLTLTAR